MTDQELDILFTQSAKRQQSVNQINATVMRSVRRDLRLKTIRKWARLIGLCFGIPFAAVCYIWALWHVIADAPLQTPLRIVCIALPLIALTVLIARTLNEPILNS